MSLLPQDASFLEHVTAFFLAFRGDGVALSPLDSELLLDWQARGIPYEVVCRGIQRAAEAVTRDGRPGARLRTLRGCRAQVESEFRRWEGLSAGRTAETAAETAPEDYAAKRLKKARALLAKALDEAPSPAHRRALERALSILEKKAASDPRDASRLVARADDALAVGFVRDLPFESRRTLLRDARRAAGPRPEGASPRARKDALRAHLVALARAHGKLVALV